MTHKARALEVKYNAAWEVRIPNRVYAELMFYVNGFQGECSGAALVTCETKDNKHTFLLSRVFLPAEQKNTAGSTDIEADAVGRLQTQLVRENVPTEQLRCHWHSHANMSVFHSGTDEDNYKVLQTGEWLVSLVLNKAGDIKASVHYYHPIKIDAINIPVTIIPEPVPADPQWTTNIEAVQAFEKQLAEKEEAERKARMSSWRYNEENDLEDPDWWKNRNQWNRDREKKAEHCSELAVSYLHSLIEMDGNLVVHHPTKGWNSARASIVCPETGHVLGLILNVSDTGAPSEYEKKLIEQNLMLEEIQSDEPIRQTDGSDQV